VCAAAAVANLDLIERDGLREQAAARGAYLLRSLTDALAGHPLVGEVRGLGLIAAVELVAGKDPVAKFDPPGSMAGRVARECLERGVITRALPEGDSIAFSPPFVITEAEIDEVVRVTREAVDAVARETQ
jgi:L-2,4-diaminobutyrate transaminase